MSDPIQTKSFWVIYDPDSELFLYDDPAYVYYVYGFGVIPNIMLVGSIESTRKFDTEEDANNLLAKFRSEPPSPLDAVIAKRMIVREVERAYNWVSGNYIRTIDTFILYDEQTGRVYTGYKDVRDNQYIKLPLLAIRSSLDVFDAKTFLSVTLLDAHVRMIKDLPMEDDDKEFFNRLEARRIEKTAKVKPI